MNEQPARPPDQTRPPLLGLAIAALVLGILSIVLSLFLVGGLLGLAGILLGVMYLRRYSSPRGMARWGVGLSLAGLLLTCVLGSIYYKGYLKYREVMAEMEETHPATDFAQWSGALAPDLSITTTDGKIIQLSELRGKRVVLDFWATWCPPCRKEIPHFVQLAKETPADQLMIVGISDESAGKIKTFAEQNGVNYLMGSVEAPPAPYSGIRSIPTTFFIDRKGVIQNVLIGYHDFESLKREALAADSEGEPKPAPAS